MKLNKVKSKNYFIIFNKSKERQSQCLQEGIKSSKSNQDLNINMPSIHKFMI